MKIADLSFSFFLTPDFADLMFDRTQVMLSILVPGVAKCMTESWEPSIRERAGLIMSMIERFDPTVAAKLIEKAQAPISFDKQRNGWTRIAIACDGQVDVSDKITEIEQVFPCDP
jgi:hypothetical protein